MKIENQESLSAASVAAPFVILPAFAFGGPDRFAKNAAKLVTFVENRLNAFGRKQFSDNDQAQPPTRLHQFLESHVQFVSKVELALSGASLVVIGRGRRAAAHKLSSDMPPEPCVRQRIHHFPDARREVPKTLLKLRRPSRSRG